jgi:F420-dependent oxidoreductase-like protein
LGAKRRNEDRAYAELLRRLQGGRGARRGAGEDRRQYRHGRQAYSYDAVSQLGYLAAKTSAIGLGSGVFPIYTRAPSLLAMRAAGLDYVSDGRFQLGIGTSGPQVAEGFHGLAFDAPLGRTREVVEICRQVWRRERVNYHGKHYQVPLPAERGTGLGKALQLINHPVRERIPVSIAALGPKNVELTAESPRAGNRFSSIRRRRNRFGVRRWTPDEPDVIPRWAPWT